MSRTGTALLLLILMAFVVSLAIGVVRMQVERQARSVAVVLDGNDARALAVESGRTLEQVLRRFRDVGLTGVAAFDKTLPDLVASGQVSVGPAGWAGALARGPHPRAGLAIATDDPRLGESITDRLAAGFPTALEVPQVLEGDARGGHYRLLIFRGTLDQIGSMGLGLDQDVAHAARAARLAIVARTLNYPGVTRSALDYIIGDIAAQQAGYMIFGEDQMLGYPALLPQLADALKTGLVVFGSVEFAKQKGDAELCRLLGGTAVRVHSITEAELSTLTREQAADRYIRAAMERNVRICYVRALGGGWGDRLNANLDYVGQIADGLKARGFALGRPSVFAPIEPRAWRVLLIGIGIAAATVMLVALVAPLREGRQWVLFGIGVLIAAGLTFAPGLLGRKALALVGALVFPTLGLVALARRLDRDAEQAPGLPSWGRVVLMSMGALAAASLVSLVGGLLTAALLTQNLFMIQADQFSGVKVAMVAPLVVLAVVLVGGAHARGEGRAAYLRRLGDNFRRFFGEPILLWQALAAVLVAGVALLLIMRTGNESAVGVSPLEMKFRTVLENLLIARPRTKEFLFGHPALMLAVAAAMRRRLRLSGVLLLAGAVGQVSLLNTFCHLHTPLALSLLRAFNGLWAGAIVACVALALWRLGARRR